jgi:single-strand DNA-binding protein
MDLNKVMLIGNITKDIQMRTTQGGQNVASFSVATNRRWKDPSTGDFKDDAQFHNVVAWGKLAEICNQYMGKGRKIYVEGRLQTRTWDDPQSGQKKYFTEIIAENIIMLDSKGVRNSSGNYEEGGEQSQQTSRPASADISNSDTNIPATEEIPTINVDEDQEEIKVKDIPF